MTRLGERLRVAGTAELDRLGHVDLNPTALRSADARARSSCFPMPAIATACSSGPDCVPQRRRTSPLIGKTRYRNLWLEHRPRHARLDDGVRLGQGARGRRRRAQARRRISVHRRVIVARRADQSYRRSRRTVAAVSAVAHARRRHDGSASPPIRIPAVRDLRGSARSCPIAHAASAGEVEVELRGRAARERQRCRSDRCRRGFRIVG